MLKLLQALICVQLQLFIVKNYLPENRRDQNDYYNMYSKCAYIIYAGHFAWLKIAIN